MATNILNLEARLRFSAGNLKSEVTKAKGDLAALRKALNDTTKSIGTSAAANSSKNVQAVRAEITRLLKEIDRLKKAGAKNLSEATPMRRASILGGVQEVSGRLRKGLNQNAAGIDKDSVITAREMEKSLAANAAAMEKVFYQFSRGGAVVKDFSAHAISLRYALYDIASVAGRVGQSMTAFASTVLQAGFAQESAFTQVEKTLVGKNDVNLDALQQQLIDLTRQIPLTMEEVSKIAMLGSQLNVAPKELAKFTETVAQFSALTGMSAEEASMGFGKIANVLGILNKDGTISGEAMNRLGSAIFAVGVNSAATEAQIINTAKQIGSVATASGLAATDVIALSGAFASLGIAPEEARGVTVQLFNEINKAANSLIPTLNKGSDRLRIFAEVAGMTQTEFANAWKDKSSQNFFTTIGEGADAVTVKTNGATYAFEKFVDGLGKGYDVQDVLKKIGLDGVRTSKGITALAKGFSVLGAQIKIAKEAGKSGSFLSDSFAVVADDINSKLKTMENSVQALYATMTNNEVVKGTFGFVLDILNKLVAGFDRFLKVTGGNWIAGVAIMLTALGGALLAIGSAVLLAGGSFLAIRTAMANAAAAGVGFTGVLGRMMTSMVGLTAAQLEEVRALQVHRAEMLGVTLATDGADAATKRLTASMKIMRAVQVATVIGLLLTVASAIYGALNDTGEAAENAGKGLDDFQQQAVDAAADASRLRSELGDLWDAMNAIASFSRKLQSALSSAGKAAASGDWKKGGQAARDYFDQLDNVVVAAKDLYGDNEADLKAYLIAYSQFLKTNGLATAAYLANLQTYIDELKGAATAGTTFNFSAWFDAIGNGATTAAADVKTLLEIVQEALKGLNDLASVYGSLRDLGGSIEGIGKSFSTMTEKGSEAFSSLNSSIEQIVTSANENPQKAANQLGALRKALWQVGVTSRSAYVMIDKAISATGKKAKVSAKDVTTYFKQLATGMADAANKEARTINDWADDIAGVIKDALDIRFRETSAQDAITGAWRNMAEAARDAADAVSEAKQSLDEINANKNVLQYQLGIAIKYGDTLRANLLQSQINKANSDAAKATQALADAQSKQSTALTGNSDAAIRNRGTMLDLVGKYQAYLVTLAKTTTDQAKLKSEAERLRGEFESQAKALGFLPNDIKEYADSISGDFVTAINEIPTNITLKLEGDTAIVQSLKSFAVKANAVLATIKTSITPVITPVMGSAPATGAKSSTVYSGANPTNPTNPVNPVNPVNPNIGGNTGSSQFGTIGASKTAGRFLIIGPGPTVAGGKEMSAPDILASRKGKPVPTAAAINAFHDAWDKYAWEDDHYNKMGWVDKQIWAGQHTSLLAKLAKPWNEFINTYGYGYATGGYVSGPGTGTSDSINARLSNGEFVMKAAAVRTYGADFMNALNQMQIARPSYQGGSAAGGSSSTMVYLSPEDRALLRAAIDRPVNLYTETTKIAQSANEGNVVLARRGMK